jgi:hypothetical protein
MTRYFAFASIILLGGCTDVLTPSGVSVRIENDDPAVIEEPRWASRSSDGRTSRNSQISSRTPGDTVRLTFTGTQIKWIGNMDKCSGKATLLLDGRASEIDTYQDTLATTFQHTIYVSPVLSRGEHTLEIRVLGTARPGACDPWVYVDAFDVLP